MQLNESSGGASTLLLAASIIWMSLAGDLASAEFVPAVWWPLLHNVQTVGVIVDDQVTDGCMPRAQALRSAAKAALVQNGFDVSDMPLSPRIEITALGYGMSDGRCVVSLQSDFVRSVNVMIPWGQGDHSNLNYRLKIGMTLLSGPMRDMQARLQTTATEQMDEFLLEVMRARKAMQERFPELVERTKDEKRRSSETLRRVLEASSEEDPE